ncbi:MAG: ParB family transcriptional regulator, chromosome partitioning protein [Clostridia bacterium]|nr:ParB family transcriptional regulator, chromosome partitioning protein [Clostridia bacterium]
MAKKGLGKGLQALIPPVSNLDNNEGEVQSIPIDKIKPNYFQPRKNFDEEKLQELADSINEHGVVQPIVVRSYGEDQYELVAGERRWRACRLLNMETIPAIVRDFNDQQVTEIALIENVQREDLNPIEEAWAYKTLLDEFNLTQNELSNRVGKSRSFIANMMRLLNLPVEIQECLSSGQLSIGHARALLPLENIDKQIELAKKIIENELTVREVEKIVKDLLSEKDKDRKKEKEVDKEYINPMNKIFEDKLQELLGTKVKFKQKNKDSGKIEIEYYTSEDLERIIEILVGNEEL